MSLKTEPAFALSLARQPYATAGSAAVAATETLCSATGLKLTRDADNISPVRWRKKNKNKSKNKIAIESMKLES